MPRRTPILLAAVALAACGKVHATAPDAGGDDDVGIDAAPPPDAAPPTLSMTLGRDAVTVPAAIEMEVTVTIARGNFDGDVVIDTSSVAGLTVEPLTIPAGRDTGMLVAAVDAATTAGSGTVVVTAHAPGDVVTAAADLAVTFDPSLPAFDMSWWAGQTSEALWAVPGWTVPATFAPLTRGSYVGTVTPRWEGLPAGSTSDPQPFTIQSETAHASFTIAAAAPPGVVTARLVLSDGLLRQSLYATVRVGPAPGLDPTLGYQTIDTTAFGTGASMREVELDSAGRRLLIGQVYTAPCDHALAIRLDAAGALDTTFGTGGAALAASPANDDIEVVDGDVDASDRVVVVGYGDGHLCAVRFGADGQLDATFHGCDASMPNLHPAAVRIRPNGRIVILGKVGSQSTVVRLLADGSLDPSFVGDQVSPTLRDFVFDGAGNIVAVGDDGVDAAVARFTASGALDPTFNGTGTLMVSTGQDDGVGRGVTVADDGDILVVGYRQVFETFPSYDGFVARIDPTGALDAGFGTGGIVYLAPTDLAATALAEVRESAALGITVYGNRAEVAGTASHVLRARLHEDGTLDPTFGLDGYDWLLVGDGAEAYEAAARFTSTGAWLGANPLSGPSWTLMKEAGL